MRLMPFVFCFFLWSGVCQVQGDDKPEIAPEFELPSIDGNNVRLAKGGPLTIVFFLGTECPLVKLYSSRIQAISKSQTNNLRVIGICSNQQDSLSDLRSFAKQQEISFEIAKDFQNRIADAFGATRTPEVFLLDADLAILYRGRVDDQYSPGVTRAAPKQQYLKSAIDQFAKGQKIAQPKTEAVGCLIGKVREPIKNSRITYCNQISRLLQKQCIECHRSGEIGPFALTDYEEVVGWADMMLEVMQQKRMPPWHASPAHGDFVNARHLEAKEIELFAEWVKNGAPYGEQKNLPPPQKFVDGWDLPKAPDQVVQMGTKGFEVPATGVVEYQYYVADLEFKEDKWIKAAQVLPGNRSVVHHSIAFIRPPDGSRFRGIGWLAAYVPGQRTFVLPDGYARFIPAGSKLVFQQHYTPNGSKQSDMTKVGLVFADENEIKHEVLTVVGIDQSIRIFPNRANQVIDQKVHTLPREGQLLSMTPHMHLRGKSFQAINERKGSEAILCDVPSYDFNWQHAYIFRKPVDLKDIGSLRMKMTFDNSVDNPFNPNPSRKVFWGDQTFEEMAVTFFDVAVPHIKSKQKRVGTLQNEKLKEPPSPRALRFVDTFFERWDKNSDGVVERNETPISLRGFGFWKYDQNRDSKLTREEVLDAANKLLGDNKN